MQSTGKTCQQTPISEQQQKQSSKLEQQQSAVIMNGGKQQPPNSLSLPNASTRSNSMEELNPEARYECAICMNWLNEPVLTPCGHRFCKSCLTTWLCNGCRRCPMDNKTLSGEQDIFPDNYTRREIGQIKLKCPHANLGCELVASPIEVERHRYNCPYRSDNEVTETHEEKCPFASIKCDFVGRPETNALEVHLKEDIALHMQLMLKAVQTMAINTWNPQKSQHIAQTNGCDSAGATANAGDDSVQLAPPPPQYANEAGEHLLQMMYQRIVILEQRGCEQAARIENLTKQLTVQRQEIDPRYSNGTILWEINNFRQLTEHLRLNANHLEYSRECYTSPYGYKFCARLNIQPKHSHVLSLHVHLMQSENDYHLDWPFNGRIKLCMVHPRDVKLSQHDTIMTKPEILAFHQPRERISTRGFGFVEYANIADIIRKGFCEDDRLIIKIQINIV